MIDALLTYPFLQYALITGFIIGAIAPLMGVFLVVRRLSLIADALSHITLAGVAAGLLLSEWVASFAGLDPILFGMIFAVIGALLIEQLRKTYQHYQELAIPILLTTGIGLAVVLISLSKRSTGDVFGYLFGNILAITSTDFVRVVIAGSIIILLIFLFYKELLYLSFDEENAKISGMPHALINLLFAVMIALVISVSMQVVGILLVSAMITLPVAIALQWAKSFKQTFLYAMLFGELAVLLGMISAYYFDLASGGAITLILVLFLLISMSIKKIRALSKV